MELTIPESLAGGSGLDGAPANMPMLSVLPVSLDES